jgi:hypothetical protein
MMIELKKVECRVPAPIQIPEFYLNVGMINSVKDQKTNLQRYCHHLTNDMKMHLGHGWDSVEPQSKKNESDHLTSF